jgi:NTE family protein
MTRALVLSGGGSVGIAWESGLIAGFAQGGVDLGQADFILGTSAGSVVGARLASGMAAAGLAEALLAPATSRPAPDDPPPSIQNMARMFALMTEAQNGTRHPAEVRRELGALALSSATVGEAEFLERIGRALAEAPKLGWPARAYACAAVDAEDGGFQLWDAGCGVDLWPAVASSCSVPGLAPPIGLKGRRYMDGGARSASNADMAAGHDIVVVVSVQPPGAPPWMAQCLAEEVESLKAGGSTVVTITPDAASGTSFGDNLMDFSRDAAVARCGLAQGQFQAEVLKQIWG